MTTTKATAAAVRTRLGTNISAKALTVSKAAAASREPILNPGLRLPKEKKGKKNVTAKLGKNARPIAVGLVAVLVAAVLIIAAVSSAGGQG